MEKRFVMKKLLIGLLALGCLTAEAQKLADSVIMVVGDKQVLLSEFEYIAHKNNEVDFSDVKSVKNYIELFKNFKLKVVEAEHLGYDKKESFTKELEDYKTQLLTSYLLDKEGEEAAARVEYDKANEYLVLSQILVTAGCRQCVTKDTVAPYEIAMDIYNKVLAGDDLDTLGIKNYNKIQNMFGNLLLAGDEAASQVVNDAKYEYLPRFLPLQKLKVFEDVAYSTPVGEVTKPFRSAEGYHIIKVQRKRPYFSSIETAYINIQADSVKRSKEEVTKIVSEVYSKAKAGEDFTKLVYTYSADTMDAGILPPFSAGEMRREIEEAIVNLKPGEISQPVVTDQGSYIFKMLKKNARKPFDEMKATYIAEMESNDRNFDLHKSLDDKLKKDYNYALYPEAYAELDALCDDYFPGTPNFLEKAKDLNKPLIRVNGDDFPQKEFVAFIIQNPLSKKTYSKDFLKDEFNFFVRSIVTKYQKNDIEVKYPDIPYLLQEYRDGILLFEISNEKIWNKPIDEQTKLEDKWIKELKAKYSIVVNSTALKKLTQK
jgi:peptidyl-prolyl cis-trans isomerase SurA